MIANYKQYKTDALITEVNQLVSMLPKALAPNHTYLVVNAVTDRLKELQYKVDNLEAIG